MKYYITKKKIQKYKTENTNTTKIDISKFLET